MPGAVELRRGAKTGGAGPDDGNFFSGPRLGGLGKDPALLRSFVDDGTLDVFDGDGWGVDSEDARAFARGGADAAGEFGEIVGLVQAVERLPPKAAIDQVVPLRDQVVDRAAGSHAAEQRAVMT